LTLHGTDLIVIAAMIVAGVAACHGLLLMKLRVILADRQMRAADQLGKLDEAIRALETRLAQRPVQAAALEQSEDAQNRGKQAEAGGDSASENARDESSEIAPEVQAAIAAVAVAIVGHGAVVNSVKAVASPWTQQGRVMVQGGHNLRVQR
jgi:hypothetical protein